jgi:hypothetical protein
MAGTTPGEGALKRWLLLGGQLVLTVVVTWLIVDRVDLGLAELRGVDRSMWLPGPLLFTAASALLLAAYFFSAALWGRMVRDLGGPTLPVADSIRMFMIANLGRYLPGKVWQIAGLAALAKGRGVPAATAAGAAVIGQGIAVVAAAAVGIGALLGGPDPYPQWGIVGIALVAIAAVLLAIPTVFRRIVAAWFRVTRTDARPEVDGVHALRWLALYTVNWAMYALSFWVLASSLGLGGDPIPVASAFAAAYVLGYAMIFAPAGLGPREGFLIIFLTPHLGAAPSGVLAIVARVWTTLVEVVPAGIFWLGYMARSPGAVDAPEEPPR